jgi:ribonuclease BN (tRNA processing enzyme)
MSVHEVLLESALDRLLTLVPNATRLREHIVAGHTEAADVGRIAHLANVEHPVLSHVVPSYDPTLTDDDWTAPVRRHDAGRLTLGRDGLSIDV